MKRRVACALLAALTGCAFAGGQGEAAGTDGPPQMSVWSVLAAELPIDPDSSLVWSEVEERVGIDLEWDMISTEIKDEQFSLIMASGDLPDIISYYEGRGGYAAINRFGEEGAFLPLQDLIEEHAPNLERILLDDPEIRRTITAQDGNIYYVPMIAAINAARGWFIRYDWLESLGLDAPTTTDELYDVLVAFRDDDPNGNGEQDEVPLIFRRRGDDAFYNIRALAYAFDADMDWVVRDGRVVFGPSEPQYGDYLAYIQRLYGEGLIDREVLTRTGNPRTELFSDDRAGAIHDWFASTANLNDTLGGEIDGFELRHFSPPVGTVDEPYTRIQMSTVRNDGAWAISATNPDPVAAIRFFDFIYSDEGTRLMNFGVAGVHHELEGGVPTYTELITDNPDGMGMHESLVTGGMQWKIGMRQHIDYERQFANAVAFEARQDYMDNYIVEEFPVLNFTAEDRDTITDIQSQIRSYVLENTSRMMVGARSVDELPRFVEELEELGLSRLTAIYQAAYDRRN
ncbi:MAG: extracellular solute-binding protein [Spirochaetales bacterium]|nr:extracellular solute-binding protein [Spirochaetales bacterium]